MTLRLRLRTVELFRVFDKSPIMLFYILLLETISCLYLSLITLLEFQKVQKDWNPDLSCGSHHHHRDPHYLEVRLEHLYEAPSAPHHPLLDCWPRWTGALDDLALLPAAPALPHGTEAERGLASSCRSQRRITVQVQAKRQFHCKVAGRSSTRPKPLGKVATCLPAQGVILTAETVEIIFKEAQGWIKEGQVGGWFE